MRLEHIFVTRHRNLRELGDIKLFSDFKFLTRNAGMKTSPRSIAPAVKLISTLARGNRDQVNVLISAGNANVELLSRVHQIALGAAHTMAPRPSKAPRQAFDGLSS